MKVSISFCPTGMIPTKEMTPNVPVTVEEIISEVVKISSLGISSVHIHPRDIDGNPTTDVKIFQAIFEGIREQSDIVLCATTSGRIEKDITKRAKVLELVGPGKPELGSLTLSSLNFANSASINSPKDIKYLCDAMRENGIIPEIEIFDVGMLNYLKYLTLKKSIEPPFMINLLLGNIASAQASPLEIGLLLQNVPEGSIVQLAGIGNQQHVAHGIAAALGLGARVGLEDNIYEFNNRNVLVTNEYLVRRLKNLYGLFQIDFESPNELRLKLGLSN
jgi:3-keto-5-aminohexanoate cleavage enzyme